MECSKVMALAGEGMNLAGVTADLGAQLLGGAKQWAPHVDPEEGRKRASRKRALLVSQRVCRNGGGVGVLQAHRITRDPGLQHPREGREGRWTLGQASSR